jgi:hypothetical protein
MTRQNRPISPPPAPPPYGAPPAPPPAPPRRQPVDQAVIDDEGEDGELDQPQSLTAALNAALARRPPVPRMSFGAESAAPVSPPSPVQAINRPPPPPPAPMRNGNMPKFESRTVDHFDGEEFNDSDEEPSQPPPPPVPARTRSPPPVPVGIMSPIMVNTPPPMTPQRVIVPDTPVEDQEEHKAKMGIRRPTLPPPMWDEFIPETPKEVQEKRIGEVMDDEDTGTSSILACYREC